MKSFPIIFVLALFSLFLQAQENSFSYSGEKRHALVIGNADYSMGILNNPLNDARAMSGVLKNVNFDVTLLLNVPTKDDMKRAIREFGIKLKNSGGVGLFYFAGHGLQVGGFNFLIPVNAEIYSEEDVEYESVDVGFVLAQMEAADNRMNIVILDACRNNPFARSFRSASRGLASINAPTGTLIAYATAPGATASDGTGINGLYTEQLLMQIQHENLKIEEVFKNVRAQVLAKSEGRQTPWESSSLVGDFYFKKDGSASNDNLYAGNIDTKTYESSYTTSFSETTNGLPSVLWRASPEGYWIYLDDTEITYDTENEVSGDDLLVRYPSASSVFLLRNYFGSLDNQLRKAEIVDLGELSSNGRDRTEWRAVKDYYWLFVNGEDISKETTNSWLGPDLKVYHPKTGRTFILKDFGNCLDNKLRPAEEIK